jgi:hypothetical protein
MICSILIDAMIVAAVGARISSVTVGGCGAAVYPRMVITDGLRRTTAASVVRHAGFGQSPEGR